jgi:small-conductance mechanosensitive channel
VIPHPSSTLLLVAQTQSPFLKSFNFTNLSVILVNIGLVWLVLRYLSKLFNAISTRRPRARFLVKLVEPVVRIFLWFGAILYAISVLAPTPDAFRAALGSAAIAIGLGAQDLIKNLIGGLVILGDRPYQLGDRVRIGDAYGEIDHIGLRSTKLTTPDDTRVTIPNADILTNKSFNANSGVPDCQVVTDVFLPPDLDPALVSLIGQQVALTSPFTYLAKPILVLLVDNFQKAPYLTLRIKAYIYDHRYEQSMQTDIVSRCKQEFLRQGMLKAWKEFHH